MTDTVVIDRTGAVNDTVTVNQVETISTQIETLQIIESAAQGPPGRDGNAAAGVLLISNALNEFSGNASVQEEAQSNIGLGFVDPLAYYILAKA